MKTGYRIALVGAGQLGSRHLQGLVGLSMPCHIYVVDPSEASLNVARQRAAEVFSPCTHSLHFIQHIDELPRLLDHAVIATTADVRMEVLRSLLFERTVHNILLEKVLFQRLSDYALADELLGCTGSRAWVSCLRRAAPVYQMLRTFFAEDPLQHVDVYGGNWGLCCNSIHFIDIVAFLVGGWPHSISTALLDDDITESKRKGFIEFTGTLSGRCGDASFTLTSQRSSGAPVLLTFRGATRSCIVDESAGRALVFDPCADGWKTIEFKPPVLSEMIGGITDGILKTGHSTLPSYELSSAYHKSLMGAFSEHMVRHQGGSGDFLPIT